MRKTSVLTLLFVIAVLLSSTAFRISPEDPVKPSGIPDSVLTVIEKTCITCHSNDGSGMAKGKLNFDKWDSYSATKQADKAAAMCKQLTKGSMPPSGFRKNNPDLIPTEAEVKLICDWSKTLVK